MLKRKQYEEKFDVDVTDDPITGETKVKDRAKDEVLVLFESFCSPCDTKIKILVIKIIFRRLF